MTPWGKQLWLSGFSFAPCGMGMGKLLHRGWKSESTGTPEQQVGVGGLNSWSATYPPYQSDEDTSFISAFISLLMQGGLGWPLADMTRKKEVIWKNHDGRKMWDYFNFIVTKRSIWKKHSHEVLYLKHLLCQLPGLQPYNLMHLEK